MSRTKRQQKVKSPIEFFVSMNGNTGLIQGIRPSKTAEGEKFRIDTPFNFILLDADCRRITGKDSQKKTAKKYSSNIVHPQYTDNVFTVVKGDKNEVCAVGVWSDIKESLKGARSSQLIHGLHLSDDGKMSVFRFTLHGRALSSWINSANSVEDEYNCKWSLVGFREEGLEGETNISLVPVFAHSPIESQEQEDAANDADNLLQEYFAALFGKKEVSKEKGEVSESDAESEEENEDIEGSEAETDEVKNSGEGLPF